MDRVKRTLCLATKAIAVPAICLTSSLLSAQQPARHNAPVIAAKDSNTIRQVVAEETDSSAKPGFLQAFAGTSGQASGSSGLLGAWFGGTPSNEKVSKPVAAKPSSTAVPLPPSIPTSSSKVQAAPKSLAPTTQDSKADWSGVPYHAPSTSPATGGPVPLSDPDQNMTSSRRPDAPAAQALTLPAAPPAQPQVTQAVPMPTSVPSVQPQAAIQPQEELEVASSRRSSRRTASSLTGQGSSPMTADTSKREALDSVADLVPKVARKPLSTSVSRSENSETSKESQASPATDELAPLPPATLTADSEDGSVEEEKEVMRDDEDTLQVTAASHRAKPGSEAAEDSENNEPEATTADSVVALETEEAGQDVSADQPVSQSRSADHPFADPSTPESNRLPTSPLSSSNDLRGQALTVSTIPNHSAASENMHLSPPTTPDFGINAGEQDSTNQMRGQVAGVAKLAGTTSELPGIRVTTKGPESILIRQNAEYEILVENRGKIDAEGVLIRALVPEWAELQSQAATRGEISTLREGSADRLVWEIGRLPAGKAETMKLQLTASRSGNYDLDIDWTLVPQKSVARVQVREPRLNLTIEGPDQVVFGESQTYKVRVLNPGNGVASNVTFTLSPNSATPQSQKIGDIPPGKEAQFDIELTAKDHGDLKIHGLAAGDLTLRAEAEKTISVSAAKLEAVLSGPQVKYQNTEGLYSLQVQNHGDAASEQIQASMRLPSGVQYLGGIEGAIQEDQLLRWDLEQLAPGAILTYQFRCNMDTTGEHLFTFDCRGTAAGAAAVSIATRVESIADLVLTVSDPVAPAPIGTDVPYEIVIRNRGSKEAIDVRAIAQFSHGVEPHRIEGQSGEVMTGQVLFDAIPRIGAGEEVRVKVIAQADRPGHHRFRAEIRSGDTVLVAEEATHYMSPEGERVSRRSSERLRR